MQDTLKLQYTPLLIPVVVTVAILTYLTFYATTRREVLQARSFAFFMATGVVWSGCYALELASTELAAKIMWVRLAYLGSATMPVVQLIFVLQHTYQRRWLSPRAKAIYFAPAILTLVVVFTSNWHQLMWGTFWLDGYLNSTHGPYFLFYLAYSYLYFIVGIVMLVTTYRRSTALHRKQLALIIISMLIPMAVNAEQIIVGESPIPYLDTAIVSMSLSAMVMAWAVFHYKSLDILPIAHNLITRNMTDGVIVMDTLNRVLYMNPASQEITGTDEVKVVGMDIERVTTTWPKIMQVVRYTARQTQLIAQHPHNGNYYEMQFSPIADEQGRVLGQLLIIHDVSERQQLQQRLEILATTDPLTGCYNRRHFFQLAAGEGERAQSNRHCLSILMIDIDHFKRVNDTLGHSTGDRVLQAVVNLLSSHIRSHDIFARYGGEEFVILLPETDALQADGLAQRLLTMVQQTPIQTEKGGIYVTISIGVASFCGDGAFNLDEMLDHADDALYIAKANGRNQVRAWQPAPHAQLQDCEPVPASCIPLH